MAGSIIVDVRDSLINQLNVLQPLADVACQFSWKKGSNKRELIYTREATFSHESAVMRAGRNFRKETGRFELVILVTGVGRSQQWSSNRAMELALPCEEFIADRKNDELGVDGLQTFVIDGDGTLSEMFNDQGTLAEISYPILYTARLT